MTEATVSTTILIILISSPSHSTFLNYFKAGDHYLPARRSRGAISWNFAKVRVPWRILFLMGGGLTLAEGSHVTKLSSVIANVIVTLKEYPKMSVSFVICFPVFLLTQVMGSSPTAHMVLPIILALVNCHQVHPTNFTIPVTLMCTMGLTSAAGSGVNAVVVGFANIRSSDVAKIGILPAVLSFLMIWGSFPLYGHYFFPVQKDWVFSNATCDHYDIE